MLQQTATVLWNRPVGPACFRMGLSCPQGYGAVKAGQFVMLQSSKSLTPLLRRPFSIAGRIGPAERPDGIELLYKMVGPGTRLMSEMSPGQVLDLLGPLGRGFEIPEQAHKIFLAAGGMGVAPLRLLAMQLKEGAGVHRDIRLFLGGRTQEDLLCREEFQALMIPVTTTTDDGSSGRQCLITDPLAETISAERPDLVCACGPPGMLQCLAGITRRYQVPCQVSLETMMACGMGACLGCAVAKSTRAEYFHACTDGPVFEADQIRL